MPTQLFSIIDKNLCYRPSSVTIRELKSNEYKRLKEIEPKIPHQLQPSQYTSETIKCKTDEVEVKESFKYCSTTSLNNSLAFSSSTLSLPEKTKKKKSKSPSDFIRKLFRSNESKNKNKSKQIAVNLWYILPWMILPRVRLCFILKSLDVSSLWKF